MNCDQALEAISAKLDGELDAAQQAALEAHLQSCQACRAVYETLQTVDVILPDTQLEPPKPPHWCSEAWDWLRCPAFPQSTAAVRLCMRL